jgi:DNA invertase Pin-like site-specific DNA recombinase
MAAEIERDLISKRTKEALVARKRDGKVLGRPKGVGKSKLDKYRVEIEALLNNGSKQNFVAARYGTTEANLHHWMKRLGITQPVEKAPKSSAGKGNAHSLAERIM